MAGESAFGGQLGYGATPTYIAGVTSMSTPTTGREEIDVTAHDSPAGYREYLPSFIEPGEVSIDLNHIHGDTGQEALWTMFNDGVTEDWVIEWPQKPEHTAPAKVEFQAFLSEAPNLTLAADDAVRGTITLRVTGAVTYTPATTI